MAMCVCVNRTDPTCLLHGSGEQERCPALDNTQINRCVRRPHSTDVKHRNRYGDEW